MPSGFIEGLKTAATSPYAFVGYICLVIAWAYVAKAQHRLRRISQVIARVPLKERAALLAKEYNVLPRSGLSAEQWIRSRKHNLFFLGFLSLLIAAIVLSTVSLTLRKDSSAPGLTTPPLITMQLSPSSLPLYVPPRSVTSVLQLHPYIGLTASQDGLLKLANDTGREGCWPSKEEMDSQGPNDHETVYRISIDNHSPRTVASGRATFRLKYNTGIKGEGCVPPSYDQKDQEDVVLIPPLDPGRSFEFFAVNQSKLCVWLIPPHSATVSLVGDEEEKQVELAFDKAPLYAAGAPIFDVTTVKWEGTPTKAGGYGIIRMGVRSCESAPIQHAQPSFTTPKPRQPNH